MKRKLKCENYNNRLEATQLDNQINYLGKTKLTQILLKEKHKEFIKKQQLDTKDRAKI